MRRINVKFDRWLKRHRWTRASFARELGMGQTAFYYHILNNKPSWPPEIAKRIEKKTDGEIPATTLVGL